jgi:hypothetical protein
MNIAFQQITTLDQVDFNDLFLSSFPDIDNNFIWGEQLQTVEQKQVFYQNQLQSAIDGDSPLQREGETFLMYKMTIDGNDHVLAAGFIEPTTPGTFRGHWYLTKKYNNSRTWIYAANTASVRAQFFASHGIGQYKTPTHADSAFLAAMKRNNANTIVEETSTELAPTYPNLVSLTITL